MLKFKLYNFWGCKLSKIYQTYSYNNYRLFNYYDNTRTIKILIY